MELRDVELFFYITQPTSEGENDNQAWTQVDIDQSSTFSFNLSQSDISDPTAVETGWSYQCSLPRTKNNEQVFSMIELLPATLTRFSSIARTPFRLYLQGTLFQEGYFGLEEITKKEYKVRFYGGLGDFFYELDNIKLSELDITLKRGGETIDKVNNSVVYNCFIDSNGASATRPSNFGFALTYQGQYDNFDSDHETMNGETEAPEVTWTDSAKGVTYSSPELNENRRNRVLSGTTYYGEYRSYYQRPMLRLQAIFEAIQDKITDAGWTLKLSSAFFNSKNPYYRDLWLVFAQLFTEQQADATVIEMDEYLVNGIDDKSLANYVNREGVPDERGDGLKKYRGSALNVGDFDNNDCHFVCNVGTGYENPWSGANGDGGTNLDAFNTDYIDKESPLIYDIPLASSSIALQVGLNVFDIQMPFSIRGVRLLAGRRSYNSRIQKSVGENSRYDTQPFFIETSLFVGDKHSGALSSVILNRANTSDYRVADGYESYRDRSFYISKYKSPRGGWSTDIGTQANYTWIPDEDDDRWGYDFATEQVQFILDENDLNSTPTLRFTMYGDPRWFRKGYSDAVNYTALLVRIKKGATVSWATGGGGTGFRTGTKLTLSDVIQTETTALDFVLSYAKMFGLYFVKDDLTKTVTLMSRNAFYHGMRLDWTDKIDYSKDFTQTPCLVDYAKGTFALDSIDGKYENDYKELYDKEYGAMVVNTGYELNREEKDYLEGNIFTRAVIARPYDQYFLGRTDVIYQDNKQSLFLQDSDGAGADANMILVFRLFPGVTTDNNSPFLISDDNSQMYIHGFMWNEEGVSSAGNVRSCNTYPDLRNTVQDDAGNSYSLYFGAPNTLYNDYDTKDTNIDSTIYNRCWQLYIQDQLDKDTKTLECYVLLQPHEVSFELFRYIIYINNTAWVLSEINGFNPLAGGATKCTLIRVNEETNYTQGQKLPVGNLIIRQGSSSSADIYNYEKQIDNAYIDIEAGEMLDGDYVEVILYIQLDSLALELGGWELQYCTDGVLVVPSEEKTSTGWTRVVLSIPKNITFEDRMFTVQLLWSSCMGVTIRIHQASATPGEFTVTRADGTVVFDFEKEINDPIEVELIGSTETLTFYYEKSKAFGNWEKTQESYSALMTPDYGGTNTAVQMQVNASTSENTYTYTFKWANQETVLTVLQHQIQPVANFHVEQSNGTVWYDEATGENIGNVSAGSSGSAKTFTLTITSDVEGWSVSRDRYGTISTVSGSIGSTYCVIAVEVAEYYTDTQQSRTMVLTFSNIDGEGKSVEININQTSAVYNCYYMYETTGGVETGIYTNQGTGAPSFTTKTSLGYSYSSQTLTFRITHRGTTYGTTGWTFAPLSSCNWAKSSVTSESTTTTVITVDLSTVTSSQSVSFAIKQEGYSSNRFQITVSRTVLYSAHITIYNCEDGTTETVERPLITENNEED